jgi:hypothetical protein
LPADSGAKRCVGREPFADLGQRHVFDFVGGCASDTVMIHESLQSWLLDEL